MQCCDARHLIFELHVYERQEVSPCVTWTFHRVRIGSLLFIVSYLNCFNLTSWLWLNNTSPITILWVQIFISFVSWVFFLYLQIKFFLVVMQNLNPLDAARFIIGIRWSGGKYFPAWPWFTFVFLQNWVLTIKSLIFYGVKVPKYVLRIISSSKLMAGNLFHMQVFNFIIYVRDNIFFDKKRTHIYAFSLQV